MRTTTFITLPIALFALSGCGAEVPTDPHQMQAGNWEISMTTTSYDVPGATAEMLETIAQGANVGEAQISEQCMSQAEADKGAEGLVEAFKNGSCTDQDVTVTGGNVAASMQCRIPFFDGKSPVTLTGTIANEIFELQMSSDLTMEEFPEGKATMVMEIKGQRKGDC